ncbi:MAG: methyltransferase domain-containing protein [Candidatus Atribacteria bacterium]|nr:methyltransferase domain-containing protein [Candidatus Atribacteria bacterium]
MHERRFQGDIKRLRNPERLERLELNRVVSIATEGAFFHRILDIGTGSGVFAEAFYQHGFETVGIDANPAFIPLAKELTPQVQFMEGLAEALPFPDESFDLVFMGLVFHETDNRLKALQEAYRVTRFRVAILEWPYLIQESGPPIAHRIIREELSRLANQTGFSWIEVFELAHFLLYRLEKNKLHPSFTLS